MHYGEVLSIVKRFREWDAESKSKLIDRLFITLAVAFVVWQFHPSLILSNSTTTGGDTGAHFIVPYLAEHEVFNHLRLTGWSSAWYDGFPLLGFYFPLPSMLVAIVNIFVTYNIAFKLITVLGSLILIPSLYALGKGFSLPRPVPLCLALVGVGYLFDTTYTIDGGNIASTLAGEYSFSLALALGIYVVSIAAKRGMTRKDTGLAAIVFALATLAHILPSFWVGSALVLLVVLKRIYYKEWRDFPYTVGIVVIAAGITAFWAFPFAYRIAYSTSMGWTKVTTYGASLAPPALRPWIIMAVLGFAVSLVRRQLFGVLVASLGILSVAAFIFLPNSAVYNARALPFWVLSLYLLSGLFLGNAVIFASFVYRQMKDLYRRSGPSEKDGEAKDPEVARVASGYSPPSSLIGVDLDQAEIESVLLPNDEPVSNAPGGRFFPYHEEPGLVGHFYGAAAVSLIVFLISALGLFSPVSWLPIHAKQSFVPSWIKWNYTGYEAKPGYAEYRKLMTTMQTIGKKYGCGPAMWEYNSHENSYGTPMALMLLPYWTGGCVGSMEGLFFESSATTPFHFLNQSELSAFPSDAMAGLPYNGLNVKLGIQHLQLLGVRYYMAFSPSVIAQANSDPALKRIATVPAIDPGAGTNSALGWTWSIYEVRNAARVVPLKNLPAVLDGVQPDQASWVNAVIPWYDNPSRWQVMPAQSGPSSWPRVAKLSSVYPVVPAPATTVSSVSEKNSSVTFDVSRTGTPVLVKTSYFPNWQVKGGNGPYRVAPNLMVVVPTAHHVVVYYGMTPVDYLGYAVSFLSVVLAVGLLKGKQSKQLPSSAD